MNEEKRIVPALRYNLFTKLYDPLVAFTARERTFKESLIQQASIQEGHRVLDIGCGTGTLAFWIKQRVQGVHVVGLDADPKIIDIARQKGQRNGVDVAFDEGYSTNLPYEDSSFDRVVSSLFFHHLLPEDKVTTVREVYRVLKPGGCFHVADWGKPRNAVMGILSYQIRWLDGLDYTRDNMEGRLPAFFAGGTFVDVEVLQEIGTVFGTMALYGCRKPMSDSGNTLVRSATAR